MIPPNTTCRDIALATRIKKATHGSLAEFNSAWEDWPSYSEQLDQYFAANNVKDENKMQAILSKCLWALNILADS